jgi:hypothetical protein
MHVVGILLDKASSNFLEVRLSATKILSLSKFESTKSVKP